MEKGDGYRADGGQPHLLSFDISHQLQVDMMMAALVVALGAICLGEPDPAVLDAIN